MGESNDHGLLVVVENVGVHEDDINGTVSMIDNARPHETHHADSLACHTLHGS